MTHTSLAPLASLMNAIFPASGARSGWMSVTSLRVSWLSGAPWVVIR
jgi:hypothetical protein